MWVYKSSKPASTVIATANQQQHIGSDEQASSNVQVPIVDATSIETTSTMHATETTSPNPMVDTNSSTTAATTPATDKVLGDTSNIDDGNGDEEDEDDEYKKIQKVSITLLSIYYYK